MSDDRARRLAWTPVGVLPASATEGQLYVRADYYEHARAEIADGNADLDAANAEIQRLTAERDRLYDREVELSAEIERLRVNLEAVVDLCEFWIARGREPGWSQERYNVWLALGYHSTALRKAKNAIRARTQEQQT